MQELTPTLIALCIVLFAGFTQGLTSFGFALIAMPFLSRIMPLNQAVPLVVVLSLCTNVLVIVNCYRFIDIKKIWLLIAASLVAAPLGAMLLVRADADVLKFTAGAIVAAFSLLLLAGKSFPVRNERLAFIPVGFLSGLLNGSISMSGPPVALFLSNQNVAKESFRANITFYAIVLNVITIASFFANRLFTAATGVYLLWLLPAMLIGVLLGIAATRRIDELLFKKLALILIAVSGLWTMAGTFYG